jgi:hypothetical protein
VAVTASGRNGRSWRAPLGLAGLVAWSAVVAACSSSGSTVSVATATTLPTTVPTSTSGSSPSTSSAPTTTASPTTAPSRPGTSPIGVIWDYAQQQEFAPYLERLAGGSTWYELEWCQAQPDPAVPINWSRADKNIERARSVGIEPMIRVRVGSCWATGGDPIDAGRGGLGYTVSAPPADTGAYEAFVRAVVERYQGAGVTTYSIENEANGEGFWRGSAEEYEALVRSGAEAIRSIDPDALVLDSGLSSTTWGVAMAEALLAEGKVDEAIAAYDRYYERRFARREEDFPRADDEGQLRDALATEQSARNRSFAEATFRLARDGVIDAFQLHFYERWDNVPGLMAYLDSALPDGMPIEVWEAGLFWPDFDGNDELVAGETARLVYLLLAHGATRVVYLPLKSNTANTEDEVRFGLIDAEYRPRAGYETVARLAEFARQGGGDWSDVSGRARAVVGDGGPGAQALIWSEEGDLALDAPNVTVTSLDGKASQPAAGTQLGSAPMVATAPSAADLRALVGA